MVSKDVWLLFIHLVLFEHVQLVTHMYMKRGLRNSLSERLFAWMNIGDWHTCKYIAHHKRFNDFINPHIYCFEDL